MNNNEIKEMHDIVASLGEITLLKGNISSFDQNISITLSNKNINKILTQSEIFNILKKVQDLSTCVNNINGDLLSVAAKLSNIPDLSEESKKEPQKKDKPIEKKENKNKQLNNPIVNNVLDYLQDIIEEDNKENE